MCLNLHLAFVNYTVIARMTATCLKYQSVALHADPFRKVSKNLV